MTRHGALSAFDAALDVRWQLASDGFAAAGVGSGGEPVVATAEPGEEAYPLASQGSVTAYDAAVLELWTGVHRDLRGADDRADWGGHDAAGNAVVIGSSIGTHSDVDVVLTTTSFLWDLASVDSRGDLGQLLLRQSDYIESLHATGPT